MSQPLPPPVLQKYYAAEGQLSDAESAFKQAWANRKSLGDHLIDAGDGHSYEKTEWISNNVGLVIGEALNRLNNANSGLDLYENVYLFVIFPGKTARR
ncbi:MAG: hypothetical protein AB7N99_05215 [Simkaniaceae bacterium]